MRYKAFMHGRRDDEAHGVKGVSEHLVQGQVPGPGRGLIGHEYDNGLIYKERRDALCRGLNNHKRLRKNFSCPLDILFIYIIFV